MQVARDHGVPGSLPVLYRELCARTGFFLAEFGFVVRRGRGNAAYATHALDVYVVSNEPELLHHKF